jgi:hypothetical protein
MAIWAMLCALFGGLWHTGVGIKPMIISDRRWVVLAGRIMPS